MKKALITSICVLLASPVLALADGKTDYNAYCAGCHGANGNVQTEKAKALNMDIKKIALKASKLNKNDMAATIEKGRGNMPSFEKQLTKTQIAAIANYVISLRKK